MATATKTAKKTPAKGRVTKKQVIAHRTKSSRDNSPHWDGAQDWGSDQFTRQFRNAMEYYRLETTTKDLRPKVVEWMELNGYSKTDTTAFRKLKDSRITSTMCGVAACLLRGMPEIHSGFNSGKDTAIWLRASIDEAIKSGAQDEDVVEETSAKPEVKKETIQDRLAEKFSEAMGEIEGAIDDFITDGKEFSTYKFLQGQNVPVEYASKIPDTTRIIF